MRCTTGFTVSGFMIFALCVFRVNAWHCEGHDLVASAAIQAAHGQIPSFLSDAKNEAAAFSCEPDIFKQKELPALRAQESSEHYFDHELLGNADFPKTRPQYVALCAKISVDPYTAGFLPYAVLEWTEKLTLAFAKHRKQPENEYIRNSCVIYAGILSHYAADMCQPLHVTVHYDGRIDKSGKVLVKTGIHNKTDAILDKLSESDIAGNLQPEVIDSLPMNSIRRQIANSITLIDSVYALEKAISARKKDSVSGVKVKLFAEERARTAASFLAGLYVYAWKKSESVSLPAWAITE